jgi:hypothetical protein
MLLTKAPQASLHILARGFFPFQFVNPSLTIESQSVGITFRKQLAITTR